MSIKGWGVNIRAQLGAAFFGQPEPPVSCTALPANTVQVVGSYLGFTAAVLDDGTMRCVGGGVNGAMGEGTNHPNNYLPVTPHITGVAAAVAGGAHITVLKRDGTVAGWGGNSWGTLGNGTSGEGAEYAGSPTPVAVPGLTGVKQVATSNGVVACVMEDGTVRAWGTGLHGALGDGREYVGKTLEGTTPQVVPGLSGVVAVACGGLGSQNHAMALANDGTVFQWGWARPCGVDEDLLSPTRVGGLQNIRAIAASAGSSFALDWENNLWAWGANPYGALFLPTDVATVSTPRRVLAGVAAISAGYQYSLALSTLGKVMGAGRNDAQQLAGVGLTEVESIFAGEHHAFAFGGPPVVPAVTAVRYDVGLHVRWKSPATDHLWEVTPSVLGEERGKMLKLPSSARAVTVPAVSGQTMAVMVRGGAGWPARTAVAVA